MAGTRTNLLTALLAVLLLGAFAQGAAAQPFDHLQCFKVKEAGRFEAVADLVPAAAPPFSTVAGCEIKVRATEYCAPVDKVLQSTDAPEPNFPPTGTDPQNDFICYKLKCPKQTIAPVEVTDQFGTRTVEGFRTKKICVPAVQGGPPAAPACGSATAPACDGGCPLAGLQCTPLGETCLCQPAIMQACGVTLGAPECHGECPPNEACVDNGGTCACAAQ